MERGPAGANRRIGFIVGDFSRRLGSNDLVLFLKLFVHLVAHIVCGRVQTANDPFILEFGIGPLEFRHCVLFALMFDSHSLAFAL
jgi:hypothetical protein